ncbi:MAG TPA: hypothetical protein VIP51_04160 [Eoetvoesiella sp.]
MTKKNVVRAIKPYRSALSALLRLFSINEDGHETLVATSSPIPKVAAMSVCQLLEQPFTIAPSIRSMKEVFRISGRTAWASATGSDAQSAALQACLQHDIETAQGALVIITLSLDSSIVENMKSALNAIHEQTPSAMPTALLVAFDEALHDQVQVGILMTGLRAGNLCDRSATQPAISIKH